MTAPKNTAEVIGALEKEYCTACDGACIECSLIGPLKLLEEWQEKHEAQTEILVSLSHPTSLWGSLVKPVIAREAGGDQG